MNEMIVVDGVPYVPAPSSAYGYGFPMPQRKKKSGLSKLLPLLVIMPALQSAETQEAVVASDLANVSVPTDYPPGNATADQLNQVKAIVAKQLEAIKKDVAANGSAFAALRKQALISLIADEEDEDSNSNLAVALLLSGGF